MEERLRIDGSAGVLPLISDLAPHYKETRPNASLIIGKGMGSSARLDALANDSIDVAVASHGVDSAALAARGMTLHHIADMPVGFAVHAEVRVANLTQAQVCDIYRGAITNWKAVGGPDMPIVPVTRPKGEVDADVLLEGIPCLRDLTMHSSVVSKQTPADMSTHLAITPGSLGMMSGMMVQNAAGTIKSVSLEGVAPTAENLESGTYKLMRRSYLVTRAAPSPPVQKFVEFMRGQSGQRSLRLYGAVPRRP